jgi:hypothetical protein
MVFIKKFFCYHPILFFLLVLFHMAGVCPSSWPQNYINFTNNKTSLNIPENYHIRKKYRDIIFSSVHHVRNGKPRVHTQEHYPHGVQFQLIRKDNALFFLFLNEQNNTFPMFHRGNVSIKKSEKNGKILQMNLLLRDNNGCYIRFSPEKERTSLEVYLFGTRLYYNVLIPMPLSDLLFESTRSIIDMTRDLLDWDLILANSEWGDSKKGLEIFSKIQEFLPSLHTAEDGAVSGDGNLVYIRNLDPQPHPGGLNCSGFAKWVADGFYFPLAGKYIDIPFLKEKHLDSRGNRWSLWYEDDRDPYFGLDWTRNIAMLLYNAQYNKTITDPEYRDVRDIPFFEYVEDVGYPVKNMEFILFFLALQDPDSFYLGSVNKTIGSNPPLQQHFHIAVFFPFFTENNTFRVIVMEKNKQTTLSAFSKDYEDTYLHLVKIKMTGTFEIPPGP